MEVAQLHELLGRSAATLASLDAPLTDEDPEKRLGDVLEDAATDGGNVRHAIGLLGCFSLVAPLDGIRHVVGLGTAAQRYWIYGVQTLIFAVLAMLAFACLVRSRQLAQSA